MLDSESSFPFALGSFSLAGCTPFPGVVMGDRLVAVSAVRSLAAVLGLPFGRAGTMLEVLEDWELNFSTLQSLFGGERRAEIGALPYAALSAATFHAPVPAPRQIFCAGANYRKHVVDLVVDHGGGPETAGMNAGERETYVSKSLDERAARGTPYAFTKLPSSVTGPFDTITLPAHSTQADWEVELAVIIGRPARFVTGDGALRCIAGYTVANDLTCRDRVYRSDLKILGTDWLQGKCSPGFLPMGPYLVPAVFVGDPQRLQLRLKLNGEIMQDESSADMIFSVVKLIEYLSTYVQLLPGDVICTGSPSGNGTHYGRYLRDGDVLEGSVVGLGAQRNRCTLSSPP